MGIEGFNIEDRQPIIPLSLDDVNLARSKEFIFDYTNNIAYIKLEDGSLFNITESETNLEFVKQYLKNNSDILLKVDIKIEGDHENNKNFQENIDHIYNLIDMLRRKEFKYACSSTDGGPANRADKVNHSLTVKESSISETLFNGEEDSKVNITNMRLLKKTGGIVNGPMIPKQKFLLAENSSYGFTLPETGVEGQIFILLKEDI